MTPLPERLNYELEAMEKISEQTQQFLTQFQQPNSQIFTQNFLNKNQ